jgi:hypothetical protein
MRPVVAALAGGSVGRGPPAVGEWDGPNRDGDLRDGLWRVLCTLDPRDELVALARAPRFQTERTRGVMCVKSRRLRS